MANNNSVAKEIIWQSPPFFWVLAASLIPMLWLVFHEGIAELLINWEREEYSHGYLIPVIVIFLIWQQKDVLQKMPFTGSWYGILMVLLGLLLYFVGSLSAVIDIIAYGFIITIIGVFYSLLGYKAFKVIFVPLAVLLFMVPLPGFLYQSLSNQLQLISSELGVGIIKLFNISVYLEGNVIDLGVYQLQVVEACNGLRYLFPLVTLGFIAAYFFKVELWKRVFVFVSTVPITVLMNSLRIGIIGITVEYWGIEAAEGILHDFEGWFVFMVCIAVLIIEMSILAKIGKDNRSLVQVFGIELPEPAPSEWPRTKRAMPKQFPISLVLILATALAVNMMPERKDIIPDRKEFFNFPLQMGEWSGKSGRMEQQFIDALHFDDYILAEYSHSALQGTVGLYIGYYAQQRADKTPHSPKACLPGGGWAMTDISTRNLSDLTIGRAPLKVNRVIIEKGENTQLVYYWFQQRDRVLTNEWDVKLYLLIDSINKSRTDGALVRLTTMIPDGEDLEAGDKRLSLLTEKLTGVLPEFVPQ